MHATKEDAFEVWKCETYSWKLPIALHVTDENVGGAFLFPSDLLSCQQFSHIPLLNSILHRFSVCCADGPSSSLSRRITGLR